MNTLSQRDPKWSQITHDDFIAQYANTFLERVDGTNKNQCFDLAVAYCEDVLGMPRAIFAGLLNASQIFTMPTISTASRFDFIENTPWSIPIKGDVVVWGKSYGPSGHVAIVHEANVNSLTAFSQNDPIGKPCIMRTYTYTHILGWLRAITNNNTDELRKQITDLKATNERIESDLRAKDQTIAAINKDWEAKLAKQTKDCQVVLDIQKQRIKDAISKLQEI